MPRKRRVIEEVGPSSILKLKAQLYKSQDESKHQSNEPIHSTYHQYGGPQEEDLCSRSLLAKELRCKFTGLGQAAATVDKSEHKRFVMEVHEEVNQARENVSQLKIKQAYLRKQLEKLKASKTEQT